MPIHYSNGKIITQQNTDESYTRFMCVKDCADVCFTWNVAHSEVGRYNISEISDQIKAWINTDHLQMKAYNNKKFNIKGRDWYACVLQKFTGKTELDEDGEEQDEMDEDSNPTDAFSMTMCNTWVNGWTYYFETEAMRDWCAECVNTRTFTRRFVFVETPECCLCKLPCETQWGHSAQPVAHGVCCSKCNRSVVLSARLAERRDTPQAPTPKVETEEERNIRLQLVAELEKTATPIVICDATIEVEKVKKIQEKSRTKDANKAQNDKKRQRAEYEKQIVEAEKARKQKEIQKKQYQQQQKAKAKK